MFGAFHASGDRALCPHVFRVAAASALLCALGSCNLVGTSSGDGGARCGQALPYPGFAVSCAQPAIAVDPGTDEVSATFDAVVSGWGTGLEGCLASNGLSGIGAGDLHLLRLRLAGDSEQSFGLVTPGLSPVVPVGASVHVAYDFQPGGFGPSNLRFELSGPDGLILYIGSSGAPAALVLPSGVAVTLGAPICAVSETCGSWSSYALTVAVDGATAMIRPGAMMRVGRYVAMVGQSQQQTRAAPTCADWFVSSTNIALSP
jgi:hypothetical protein